MKQALVGSHAERRAKIEAGEMKVVGVNAYIETEPSPLTADLDAAIMTADPQAEANAIADVAAWRGQRDQRSVDEALERLQREAKTDANLMDATLARVRAGATVGEWAGALREVFGEYRAPTGVTGVVGVAEAGAELDRGARAGPVRPARSWAGGCASWSASPDSTGTPTAPSRSPCARATPASRSSTRASA